MLHPVAPESPPPLHIPSEAGRLLREVGALERRIAERCLLRRGARDATNRIMLGTLLQVRHATEQIAASYLDGMH